MGNTMDNDICACGASGVLDLPSTPKPAEQVKHATLRLLRLHLQQSLSYNIFQSHAGIIRIIVIAVIFNVISLTSFWNSSQFQLHYKAHDGAPRLIASTLDTEGLITQSFNTTEGFDTKLVPSLDDSSTLSGIEKILIIASVPKDAKHVLALWTHLECVTKGIDKVLISAPDTPWSRDIVSVVIRQFRWNNSVNNNTHKFELDAAFYVNDRYDAGLWCDGLKYHFGFDGNRFINNITKPHAIYLINDSSMALRQYDSLTNKVATIAALANQQRKGDLGGGSNLKLVGLNGHLRKTHRGCRYYNRPGGCGFYWIESVYRGLTPDAVPVFFKHSCVHDKEKPTCQCTGNCRKKCIVNKYEKGLADEFNHTEVDAMHPSYLPNDVNASYWGHINHYPNDHWIDGKQYFQYLLQEHNFPLQKVKNRQRLPTECTKLAYDTKWFQLLQFPTPSELGVYQEEMSLSAKTQ